MSSAFKFRHNNVLFCDGYCMSLDVVGRTLMNIHDVGSKHIDVTSDIFKCFPTPS